MTAKKQHKISTLPTTKRNKYYKVHDEGYGFQNGDFAFSDDLDDWKYGKTRRGAKYPDLF